MADNKGIQNSNSDLDIKIGISLEDYKSVANKINSLVDNVQKNIKNVKITNKNDTEKELEKTANNLKNAAKRIKFEFEDIGRGYSAIVKAMKKEFGSNGDFVKVTNIGKNKRDVEAFTVEIQKQSGAIEKLRYQYEQLNNKKGFVLQSKTVVDNSAIEAHKKALEISNTIKDFNLAFQKLGGKVSASTLADSSVSKQIDNIKTRLNGLKNLSFSKVKEEINSLKKSFNQLKQSAEDLEKIKKSKAQSDRDEAERLNKIFLAQEKYRINLEKLKRENTKPLSFSEINQSVEEFENRVKRLNNVSLDGLSQEIKELDLQWKELKNTVNSKAAEVGNHDVSWIDKITHNTKKFFEWYISANAVMQTKEAIVDSIREIGRMDEAMVELNKVTDMSAKSLRDMKSAAMELSTQFGKLAPDVMLSMAEFGRITKDENLIKELTEVATLASNVTSFSPDDAAKAINTTILSMNLHLKDSMNVLDQFNEIQNNYRTNAEDLAEAIGAVGSAATQAGIELNKLNGYTTALVSATGISGSEAGVAQKSFISRMFRIGSDGVEDAGKAEEMLNTIGVQVRDLTGDFRDYDDILVDIYNRWDDLSKIQQIAVAQAIGGTQHYSKFVSLMNNFDIAIEASEKALNSQGSAIAENEKALDSITGKWKIMMANLNNTKLTLIEDDTIKGILDLGISLTGIISKLTGFKTVVAGLILLLSKKINIPALDAIKNIQSFSGINTIAKYYGENLINNIKRTYTAFKDLIVNMKAADTTAKSASIGLKGFANAIESSGVASKVAAAGFTLLKGAMTFGVGMAISFLIEKFIKLTSKIINAKDELRNFNREMTETMKADASDVSKAIGLQEQINNKIGQINNTEDKAERAILEKELLDLQKQMAEILPNTATGFDAEGNAIANNNDLIQQQINLKKEMIKSNALKFAEENEQIDILIGKYEKAKDKYERMELAKLKGEKYLTETYTYKGDYSNGFQGGTGTIKTKLDADEFKRVTQEMEDAQQAIQGWISAINALRAVGFTDSEISGLGFDVSAIEKQTMAIKENTYSIEENRKAAYEKAKESIVTPEMAGESFAKAVEEAQKMRDIINEINEAQMMTPEIIKKVADSYPDLIGKIHNAQAIQDALNEKINEQVDIQRQAYLTMIGDDEKWYEARIANGNEMQRIFNEFASNFVDINSEAYNFDASQYKSLNEAKAAMLNILGRPMAEFLSKYVGGNIESYEKDLRNFTSLAQAKTYILGQLNSKLQQLQANYNQLLDQANNAIRQYNTAVDAEGLRAESRYINRLNIQKGYINDLNTAIAGAKASFEGFYTSMSVGMPSFSTPNLSKSGSNLGKSGSSKAKDAEKDYQAERERMEREANQAIESLRNKLINALKKKYDDLRKKELEPIEKEIEMKQKELERLQNGGMNEKERLAALKEELRLWEKNDSTFAKQKIAELKKEVKEAELNLEIKELEEKKETINSKYNALLQEEKLYAEASKMIQQNKYEEMKNLLLQYGEEFKDISLLLGKSIVDVIKQQLDSVKAAYDFLKGNTSSYSGASSSSSSNKSSSSSSSISKGSKVKVTDNNATIYVDSYTSNGSGTWRGAGVSTSEGLYVVNMNNGRAALSRTNNINGAIGWIDLSKIAKFKIGGDVGEWNDNDGKLAVVHSGERVLTKEQNRMFSDLIYKTLPQFEKVYNLLLNKVGSGINNINNSTNNSNITFYNNFDVVNQTQFDISKFKMDIVKEIKRELNRGGLRTAF